MAKDFRTTQIETTKIILSGGIGSSTLGGIVYSGSVATDREGGIPSTMLDNVGSDVELFISGTINGRGNGGIVLVGGDLMTSGTFYAYKGARINISAGTTYPENNFSVKSGLGDAFAVFSSPADVDASDPAVYVNPSNQNIDFSVNTGPNNKRAIYVDAEREYIAFMSGGNNDSPSSTNPRIMSDVNVFFSGAIGSRGTNVRGASLFGGDVVHSGSVYILENGSNENLKLVRNTALNQNAFIVFEETAGSNIGQIYANSANMFLQAESGDLIFRAGTENLLRIWGSVERIGIGNTATTATHMLHVSGTQFSAFRVDSGLKSNLIDAKDNTVYFLSGGAPSSFNEASGNDVGFYVSGSVDGRNLNTKGISVFGGDLVVSGGMVTQHSVHRNTNTKSANFNVIPSDHFLFVDSSAGHVTASLQAASQAGPGRELIFKDIAGFADVNNIVLRPNGSDNIEGVNDDLTIKVPSGSIQLICDGVSNYYVYGERS